MSKPRKKRKSRARNANGLPKGGYLHPDGGHCLSNGKRVKYRRSSKDVRVIATRRKNPDLRQLARVLVEIARQNIAKQQQLEKDKQIKNQKIAKK